MATRTAADRRAAEKAAFDAYLDNCPSRKLLATLADKWVTLTICALGERGTMRFSALQRHIAGVSQKMLTQTLRNLERDGILTRTVTASVPVTVEYELTTLGQNLLTTTIGPLKSWAENHYVEIERAQLNYDADRETA